MPWPPLASTAAPVCTSDLGRATGNPLVDTPVRSLRAANLRTLTT